MTIRIFILQLCIILCLYSGLGFSQPLVTINLDSAIICPITSSSNVIPSFSEQECKTTSTWKIDPQNTALWVKATVDVPEDMLKDKKPHSVYISGKAASKVHVN